MVPPSGTCISVRVARSSMPAEAVAANTLAALKGVVKHIPKKWANVQVGHAGLAAVLPCLVSTIWGAACCPLYVCRVIKRFSLVCPRKCSCALHARACACLSVSVY